MQFLRLFFCDIWDAQYLNSYFRNVWTCYIFLVCERHCYLYPSVNGDNTWQQVNTATETRHWFLEAHFLWLGSELWCIGGKVSLISSQGHAHYLLSSNHLALAGDRVGYLASLWCTIYWHRSTSYSVKCDQNVVQIVDFELSLAHLGIDIFSSQRQCQLIGLTPFISQSVILIFEMCLCGLIFYWLKYNSILYLFQSFLWIIINEVYTNKYIQINWMK